MRHAPAARGRRDLLREGDTTGLVATVTLGRVALHMHVPGRGQVTILTVEAGPPDGAVRGDLVSVHSGWACDRLSPRQALALSGWTQAALAVTDAAR